MIEIDWTPGEGQLRRFGLFGLVLIPVIGGVVSWIAPPGELFGIWLVSGVVAVTCGLSALLSPKHLKPFYLLVTGIAFVLLFPVTLILRMFGFSPENREIDGDEEDAILLEGNRPDAGDFDGKDGNIPDDDRPGN